MRGGGGGALFLVMQVLEIPAGGRGFPLVNIISIFNIGGGLQPKETERYRKFQIWDWFFFGFFWFFFGFSILANFD